jgi:acyl-CoA thioester hydrolase
MANTFSYHSEVFFDELDGLGLLHHTRFLLHLERAQQKFFQHLLGVDDFNADRDEDIHVVVHSVEARFRQPFRVPGPLTVDYQIDRIRSGGLTLAFTVRHPSEAITYCEGTRTVCKISGATQQPAPWTKPFRAALDKF